MIWKREEKGKEGEKGFFLSETEFSTINSRRKKRKKIRSAPRCDGGGDATQRKIDFLLPLLLLSPIGTHLRDRHETEQRRSRLPCGGEEQQGQRQRPGEGAAPSPPPPALAKKMTSNKSPSMAACRRSAA